MNKEFLIKIGVCLMVFALCLYSYIDKQNQLTKMRMEIPHLAKEIKAIKEENTRLQYEIDQFESPAHLMELARSSEFSHLKHPLLKEILTVPEAQILATAKPKVQDSTVTITIRPTLAVGAKE
jgi:hypothetical protein